MDYIKKTDDEDQIQLPERLAEQARLNGMGSEREAEAYRRGVEDGKDAIWERFYDEPGTAGLGHIFRAMGCMLPMERAAIHSLTAPDKEGA
ncbi:hypothetical protein ASG62_16050 [Aureimonas sp. Leaf427]|nr:hypothetical protein ASG62_16050 [Aureimonas sp. Leaf427]